MIFLKPRSLAGQMQGSRPVGHCNSVFNPKNFGEFLFKHEDFPAHRYPSRANDACGGHGFFLTEGDIGQRDSVLRCVGHDSL